MKDNNNYIIEAIKIFSNLYPDYQIYYIIFWGVDNNIVKFKIKGIKDDEEVIVIIRIDIIKIDL